MNGTIRLLGPSGTLRYLVEKLGTNLGKKRPKSTISGFFWGGGVWSKNFRTYNFNGQNFFDDGGWHGVDRSALRFPVVEICGPKISSNFGPVF